MPEQTWHRHFPRQVHRVLICTATCKGPHSSSSWPWWHLRCQDARDDSEQDICDSGIAFAFYAELQVSFSTPLDCCSLGQIETWNIRYPKSSKTKWGVKLASQQPIANGQNMPHSFQDNNWLDRDPSLFVLSSCGGAILENFMVAEADFRMFMVPAW